MFAHVIRGASRIAGRCGLGGMIDAFLGKSVEQIMAIQ